MPIKEMPQFKAVPAKMLEIPQPAIGGLNLKDLEFEQEVNQSPYMKNVMYRNGAFSKRYGQAVHNTYADTIYATVCFGGEIFVHSGTKIYKDGTTPTQVGTGFPEESGLFIVFRQNLYYLCPPTNNGIDGGLFHYTSGAFSFDDGYVPEFIINCAPDGIGGDTMEDLNILGTKFRIIYNGNGTDTDYHVENYDPDNIINWSVRPTIEIDDAETQAFDVIAESKIIRFSSPPADGDLNVSMVFTMDLTKIKDARKETLSCKYYDTYGGTYNSRVFLAGDGKSRYYWSQSYDITYFPSQNYDKLGNTEDDITGFGRQYNTLIAFKPRETYQIVSYIEDTSSAILEEDIGLEFFRPMLVNPIIGCDAPHSVQVINNLLTWFNSDLGVCTLVSTNIADERNIRVISRNIEKTNNFGLSGILDIYEDPLKIVSADYDKKYFLVFPTSGKCFVWDYEISPYFYSSATGETPPAKLTWFYFDKIYANSFIKADKELLFISDFNNLSHESFTQYVLNGNFETTDNWTSGSATFTVSDNVASLTVSRANQGLLQFIPDIVVGEPYYVTMEVKNPSPAIFAEEFEGNSNEFVRKSTIIYPRGETPEETVTTLWFWMAIDRDLDEPATIEVKNVMMFKMSEFPDGMTQEAIDMYLNGEYTSGSLDIGADYTKSLIRLNDSFYDLNFEKIRVYDPIDAFYMTPFMQFGAVEMLKNLNNIYVQCRGDTNSVINISYYTDDSTEPEPDPEPIRVDGGRIMWDRFTWNGFRWFMNIWGNVFRRKCNLKKIEMCAVHFDNNEVGTDMSITHIGMQYQLVKYVR